MAYNLHVIIVHFPIALLTLYSVIKILPFQRFFPKVAWRDIERVLLFFGVLGAFAALFTGPLAERLVVPRHDLLEAHEFFARLTILFYGLLVLGEIAALANAKRITRKGSTSRAGAFLEKILGGKICTILLALAGLAALTITGMLGGVMAFGLTADPMAPYVLKMLGLAF